MKIKLIPAGVLAGARQRLGAEHSQDTSQDRFIEKADPIQIIAWYSGWRLGHDDWGREIVQSYLDMINAIEKDKEA